VDDLVEKCLLRGTTPPSLWIPCGQRKNVEISARNSCATGVPGSRNTSLPETGTTPGATPERRKNRETGASSGCLVPAAGRLTKTPAGQPAGQRPKTGPGPCISYMRGPGLFPGPAHSGLGPSPGPSHSWPGLFRVGPFPSLAHSRPGPIPGPAHPGHYRTSHGNVTGHPDAAKSAATVTRGTSRPLAGGSTAGRRVNGGPTAR
jgi:hypothetical protein